MFVFPKWAFPIKFFTKIFYAVLFFFMNAEHVHAIILSANSSLILIPFHICFGLLCVTVCVWQIPFNCNLFSCIQHDKGVIHPFVLGQRELLTAEEVEQLRCHLQTNTLWSELKELFKTNSWANDSKLVALLEAPLMRLCAGYLYLEKRRGYALDNVGMTDGLITAVWS